MRGMSYFSWPTIIFSWLWFIVVAAVSIWGLSYLGPILYHGVETAGQVVGKGQGCYEISYHDTTGRSFSKCLDMRNNSRRVIHYEVGTSIARIYDRRDPRQVTTGGSPLLTLSWIVLLSSVFTFSPVLGLWWYGWRLKNWARSNSVTLRKIYMSPLWSNPFGAGSGMSRYMITFRVIVSEATGEELEAWVKYGRFWWPSTRVETMWAKQQADHRTLDVMAADAQRGQVRADGKNPNQELLFK